MQFGLDILGAAQFPREALRALPKGFALGFFANTFGNAWPVIKRLANSGKFPRIRVHAIWEDDHKYIPAKHDKQIKREFQTFLEIAGMNPGIDWQFSPFCEADGDLRPILKELREFSGRLVNSVWRAPLVKPALAINEIHGDKPPAGSLYNYSTDGESVVDLDMISLREKHRLADTFYFWHAAFNGKLNDTDRTPRPERKAWPTAQLIESIAYLANPVRAASIPEGCIWKSHADRHMTPPEPRAYKPVYIAHTKQDEMVLRNTAGKVIARMPYGGLYQDGKRHLYRLDRYGYEVAMQNDNRLVTIDGQGKVNPAFRAGIFR